MFYEVDSTKLYILVCMCFLKTQVGGNTVLLAIAKCKSVAPVYTVVT